MSKNIDLKNMRKEFGMSQEYFANKLGMSRQTLAKIEKGKRRLAKVEQQKVQEVFGIVANSQKPLNDIRISIPQKNIEKFKEVLLYVLEKTVGKPNVGMTVLYKLLYFIDFNYYEKNEEQLMGLTYFKNTHGPAPREFAKVVEDMKKEGLLEEIKSKYFQYDQKKFLPHKQADLSVFNGKELEIINNVLARYADKSANEISRISYEDMPWAAAKDGEDLEYEHVFYRPDNLSVREYEKL
jgi:DNA-binding XRE family transcriptional regulator/uncharacterized phage-associated protein